MTHSANTIVKTQFTKDIQDKDTINTSFLIKYSAVAMGKNGKAYMNLVLMDRTGELEARIWSDVERYSSIAIKDNYAHVEGKCQAYQGRRQVVISELRMLREDEVSASDYATESKVDAETLYSRLLGLIDTMEDPHCKALAESALKDDEEIIDRFKRAPAAKSVHHAYRGGLLEHVVSVTGILDQIARHYGPKIINRDLLFLGAIFHDIGKLYELSFERITDYTTEGKLIGHLVMGVEMITKKIALLEATPGRLPSPFPEEKTLIIKHIILAHHGELEYGSPKRPKCVEALVVHMIDDLDSKVNSIRGIIEQDQTPGKWTAFSRQYERFFFKGETE